VLAPWTAYNDVIEDFNRQEFPGSNHVPGYLDVTFTWGGVAAGMVVYEDAGTSGCYDDRAEDFKGPNEAGVQVAKRDQVVANDSAPGVQDQNDQGLFALVVPVGISDVLLPIPRRMFWGVD